MRIFRILSLSLAVLVPATPGFAEDYCFALWHERNSLYNDYGYCFVTRFAKQEFNNDDCYTKKPKFPTAVRKRIAAIQKEERALGCRVNR